MRNDLKNNKERARESGQACVTTAPQCEILVPSVSDPRIVYSVLIPLPTDGPEEYICGCQSYHYRGTCKHQRMAWDDRCGWDSMVGPEEQTPRQEAKRKCPRCYGDTLIVL
jgi:hypothetical protein